MLSISHDVKAANSALAKFLRRKEDEEATLGIGKRKPKRLQDEEKRRLPGGRGRWMLEPDFTIPTPMVDRPHTESGATSFHFSYISISKKAVPLLNGMPLEGFHATSEAGHRHSKYIERDGAPEMLAGAHHAEYLEREGAVEHRVLAGEALTQEEAAIMGPVQRSHGGVPSVFSNISDDPFERQEYWRAIERYENEPRKHYIFFEPDVNPRWWKELETTERLPAHVKTHALTVAEAYRVWLEAGETAEGEKERFVPEPLEVTAEEAGAIIDRIRCMKHYSPKHEPFRFRPGRGGRIQYRIVAELPYELSAEDRALIVQNFCETLENLEERKLPSGETVMVGMMYTAVIHAPDASNDRRNYHLHLIAHDRPAEFLDEFGKWDFEVTEISLSHRKERVAYPYCQNKIRKVNNKNFIPLLRRTFAEITNAALAKRGITRRYDPRKYKDMGIDRTPTGHLGTKAAALEAIGFPTIIGQLNAIAIWGDAERSIRTRMEEAERSYRERHAELIKLVNQVAPPRPEGSWILGNAKRLIGERARDISQAIEGRQAIMIFDHLEAKAKSRAVRTRQTCLQLLADIEAGRADRTTTNMKDVIQARWQAATDHIAAIDKALAPHRETLRRAAREIERLEGCLRSGEDSIRKDVEVLDRMAAAAVRATAMAPSRETAFGLAVQITVDVPSSADAALDNPFEEQSPDSAPTDKAEHRRSSEAPPPPTQIQPVSIEGFPIVEPTIGPPSTIDQDREAAANSSLAPLLRTPANDAVTARPTAIVDALTAPSPQARIQELGGAALPQRVGAGRTPPSNSDAPRGETGDEKNSRLHDSQPSATTSLATESEKVRDRMHEGVRSSRESDAEQLPPKAAVNGSAGYQQWNDLVDRIANERILIQVIAGKGGATIYKVPSLSPEERNLLHAKRFHGKTIKRLAGIAQHQQNEIDKIVRWITSHGQNPDLLILEGRVAKLGNVKPGVRTLLGHWRRHPAIVQALRQENSRRIELAAKLVAERARAAAKPKTPSNPEHKPDWTAKKADAERVYPTPENVYTREVREFTRLLRKLASADDLQAAADRIRASPAAREDVQRHTPELATAYSLYGESLEPQILAGARLQNSRAGYGD